MKLQIVYILVIVAFWLCTPDGALARSLFGTRGGMSAPERGTERIASEKGWATYRCRSDRCLSRHPEGIWQRRLE